MGPRQDLCFVRAGAHALVPSRQAKLQLAEGLFSLACTTTEGNVLITFLCMALHVAYEPKRHRQCCTKAFLNVRPVWYAASCSRALELSR
eukprot:353681-Chlamydomonas_euryale.AAC.6